MGWDQAGTGGASALADLSDVDTSGRTVGDQLTWDGSLWVPDDPGSGGGGGGVPAKSGCRAEKSGNQTIANTTFEAVTFDVEVYDVGGYHDNSTNPSRFTVPTGHAGLHLIVVEVEWATGGGNQRQLRLYKNTSSPYGATGLLGRGNIPAAANMQQQQFLVDLAVGDYVEIAAYQDSGGSLALTGGDTWQTSLTIERQTS